MLLQSNHKRACVLRVLLLIGAYAFLLLLSYGFPVTGDDWWFTTRYQNESIPEALTRGFHTAVKHYYTTNGRYFGNFLSGAMGCSKLLRELVRCGFIFGIFLSVCHICRLRKLYGYLAALALTIALPARIYAQTYAWAAGFFNYVPPTLLLLLYLSTVISQFSRKNSEAPLWALPYFLLGLCTQFFVENVSVAMCLLSGVFCVAWAVRNKKLSWRLTGHLAGVIVGCVLMFLAPGYQNIGTEGYREIPQGKAVLLGIEKNFSIITSNLMENNWLVIGLLTALCLYLLFRVKAETARARRTKCAGILLLCLASAFFYADQAVLRTMQHNDYIAALIAELIAWLDFVFVLCYLVGIVIAIWQGIADSDEKWKALLFIGTAVCILAPLLVVNPIGPRCLYLPHILLVCTALCIGRYCLRTSTAVEKLLRLPILLLSCVVFVSFLWMMLWNGHTESIRTEYTARKMSQGVEEITLPHYPYQEYVHGGASSTIGRYYYYNDPNDITFNFVQYKYWTAED